MAELNGMYNQYKLQKGNLDDRKVTLKDTNFSLCSTLVLLSSRLFAVCLILRRQLQVVRYRRLVISYFL